MRPIKDDLRQPVHLIERGWIRKPATLILFLTMPILFLPVVAAWAAAWAALEEVYLFGKLLWWDFGKCWRGESLDDSNDADNQANSGESPSPVIS